MLRRIAQAAVAATLLTTTLTAVAAPAAAAPEPAGSHDVSTDLLAALQRDLALTPAQARTRLAMDASAATAEQTLRDRLGARFAGAWLSAAGDQVIVAVTDPAAAGAVTAQGAQARVVARSEAQLTAVKDTLDRAEATAPAGLTSWFVDVVNNTVVLEAAPAAVAAAEAFVARAGVPAGSVTVAASTAQPRTLYDVRGGDAFYMGGGRCSIGFSVRGGFVTAGHCGSTGTAAQGYNRVAMGSFAGSSFPTNDYAWVRTNTNWVPRGVVNRYNGGTVAVRGSSEAAVGASICRSGSTTGWRCGTVQAKNQTVRYAQGSVSGLTRTNACAEPGDSGGSWLSGNQAQGVTSGGSGNCRIGGTTFFQPVNEILSRYGLSLVTS